MSKKETIQTELAWLVDDCLTGGVLLKSLRIACDCGHRRVGAVCYAGLGDVQLDKALSAGVHVGCPGD